MCSCYLVNYFFSMSSSLFSSHRCLLAFVQVPHVLNRHFRYSTSIFQKIGFSSVSSKQSDNEVNELKDQEKASDGPSEDCSSGSKNTSEPGLRY